MKLMALVFGAGLIVACGRSSGMKPDHDGGPGGGSGGSGGSGSDGGGAGATCGGAGPLLPWPTTGKMPVGLASGDFNRDGIPDLVTANKGDGTVSVLLGQGGGRFAPKADYPAHPNALAVADFDRDGKLDVAVAASDGTYATVLLGNDDGSLQSPMLAAQTPGAYPPVAVAAGDFNGDGAPDLAVVSDTVTVVLGTGDGTFGAPASFAIDPYPIAITAVDLNHDGKLDLVVATGGGPDVLLGNGDGTFQGKLTSEVTGAAGVAIGDVTGDGIPDLAVAAYSAGSHVVVLRGSGTGTFVDPQEIAAGDDWPDVVALADLDGDGKLDIVTGNNASATVLRGHGDGTFDAPTDYAIGAQAAGIVVADLSGDGIPDAAIASSNANAVSLLVGTGVGAFAAPTSYPTARGPTAIALADLDGDHVLDAVVLDRDANTVSVLTGHGDGTFAAKRDAATGVDPNGLAVADFDGDGVLDIATANLGTNSISLLLGRGDGSLRPKQDLTIDVDVPTAIVAADLTSDGRPDLVVANEGASPSLQVFVNQGGGMFAAGASYASLAVGTLAIADLDGNGQPDLLATCDEGGEQDRFATFAGNGNGTFASEQDHATTMDVYGVAAADLDHDGHADVVIAGGGSQPGVAPGIGVLAGAADGSLKPEVDYPTGAWPRNVSIADLDGDGVPDLVVADPNGNAVSVLTGKGDGTFAPARPFAGGMAPTAIAIGDVDGDGAPDLVIADQAGAITVLRGACMR